MIHVAVNKNREEAKGLLGGEVTYDAADIKPLGRSVADTPALNTRNESIRLGTWNVRTLNHAGNMDNLTQEMEEMKTDILGISETHWSGCGVLKREKKTHVYMFRRRRKQTWSRQFTQFKSKQKSKRVLDNQRKTGYV